jgi:hypothetical protein
MASCSVSPTGHCTVNSQCIAPAVCSEGLCVDPQAACFPACQNSQACLNGTCVAPWPAIGAVTTPTSWSTRSQRITITAIVDDTQGPGLASAKLRIAGQEDVAGTTSDTGKVRTYSFTVPGTVQSAGSETPVPFTIVGTDVNGNVTPAVGVGSGKLLIDDSGPTVSSVTVNGGDAIIPPLGGTKWFKQLDDSGMNTLADIDVQATIADEGSGVDSRSLMLVKQGTTGPRLDHNSPTPDGTAANVWHLHVPRVGATYFASGTEGKVAFQVIAKDALGLTQKADTGGPYSSIGTVGVDGVAPALTFTATYPANGAGCDSTLPGGGPDLGIVCGHDGSHWWRRGLGANGEELTAMTFSATDSGSGMDPGSGTCSITGSIITCTPTSTDTLSASTATYSFKPNFSDATLGATDPRTGGSTATVNVAARDAVGNLATASSSTFAVSRLRWVQQLSTDGVTALAGAPIVSSRPVAQIIVAGNSAAKDPIVAVKPTAGIAWTGGKSQGLTAVTNNMAYDSTGAMLYVLGGASFWGLHVTATAIDKYCTQSVTTGSGSPVIYTPGASGVVLATDSGSLTPGVDAFFPTGMTSGGGRCGRAIGPATIVPTAKIGPPTAAGGTIYWTYDNSVALPGDAGVVTATFGSSGFSGITSHALGTGIPAFVGTYGFIALADAMYFGNGGHKLYYNFSFAFPANWSSGSAPNTAFGGSIQLANPMVVANGLALGASRQPGQIFAYNKLTGAVAWNYPSGINDAGTISSPVTAPDGVIYFTVGGGELLAIAPGAKAATKKWSFSGPLGLTLSGAGTEAAIDGNGILYFGNGGNLYALITDVGSPATGFGKDWPRTGFDNCNSSNTAFTCQ